MTVTIYVTSTHNFSGKSALCVGLLRRFREDGFVIGYMKPVSTTARIVGSKVLDEDAQFIKSSFSLAEPLDIMAPVILTDQKVAEILRLDKQDLSPAVLSAFDKVSRDKDIVVLEGGGSLREGWIVNLAPPHVSQLLGGRELVVVPFQNDLQLVDDLITGRERLGPSLLGAVVNRVPKHRLDFLEKEIKPFVERQGVPILAMLPNQRVLLSVTVAELAEGMGGEILCGEGGLDELVENLLVGAMSVDSALTYLRRKPNKALITGGDRADLQAAALETGTKCLVLTGNIRPGPRILAQAEDRNVPIILTRTDTMTAIERIEKFFGKTRFHQEQKIQRFEQLLKENMDFEALYNLLGLKRPKS
jgi:BioD-like phosphotransacetylase family protein